MTDCSCGKRRTLDGTMETFDDPLQTRVAMSAAQTAGGVATLRLDAPDTGNYWLIERIAAEAPVGGTAALAVYQGDALPQNFISGGVSPVGLPGVVGSFLPHIELPYGNFLTVQLTGLTFATGYAVSFNVYYRNRTFVPVPQRQEKFYRVQPQKIESPTIIDTPADQELQIKPPPPHEDAPDPAVLAPTGYPSEDGTYF